MRRTALTQATDVPEAVPPHEPPSPPLTPDDVVSVQGDLDETRAALRRHEHTVPLAHLWREWNARWRTLVEEVARLETMLAYEDDLNTIDQGCLAAVLAGGKTWEQFMADAEQRLGLPWAEIKILLDERYANRTKATTGDRAANQEFPA